MNATEAHRQTVAKLREKLDEIRSEMARLTKQENFTLQAIEMVEDLIPKNDEEPNLSASKRSSGSRVRTQPFNGTIVQACLEVLEHSGHPLGLDDLFKAVVEYGATPKNTNSLQATISKKSDIFVRDKNSWALKEWKEKQGNA